MKRLLPLALPMLLFAHTAKADPLEPSSPVGLPKWQWSRPTGSATNVRIDLVRADVTIVAATDNMVSVRIEAEGTTEDAARIWIDVARRADAYVLSDRYPQRPPWTMYAECLPPSDERGDFWVVSTKFKVTVAVPRGTQPTITIRSGTVRDTRSKLAVLRKSEFGLCGAEASVRDAAAAASLDSSKRPGLYACSN